MTSRIGHQFLDDRIEIHLQHLHRPIDEHRGGAARLGLAQELGHLLEDSHRICARCQAARTGGFPRARGRSPYFAIRRVVVHAGGCRGGGGILGIEAGVELADALERLLQQVEARPLAAVVLEDLGDRLDGGQADLDALALERKSDV